MSPTYVLMNHIIGKNLITPAGSEIRGKRPHSAQKSRGSTGQWTGARNITDQVMASDLRGVLVAISIPIFTSQLAKARLATNQANARAAYAAVEAQYLQDDTKTGDFTYNVSDGKLAATASTSGTEITGADKTNISGWTTGTTVGDSTLGKTTFKTWTLTVGTDGTVTAYKAGN